MTLTLAVIDPLLISLTHCDYVGTRQFQYCFHGQHLLLPIRLSLLYRKSLLISRKGGYKLYEKFENLLIERNLTAYRVAKDTGLAPTVFSDWKTGKSKPKVDKLKILADYFGVSIEYFLE